MKYNIKKTMVITATMLFAAPALAQEATGVPSLADVMGSLSSDEISQMENSVSIIGYGHHSRSSGVRGNRRWSYFG